MDSRRIMSNPADTWVCIGAGPSLTEEDVEYCRAQGWSLATCNNSIKLAPDAKIFHACDKRWWLEESGYDLLSLLGGFPDMEIWTGSIPIARDCNLDLIKRLPGGGWSDKRGTVYSGGPNAGLSGYHLIQIVGWRKPARIILLGYDMKFKDGKVHWHEDYTGTRDNMSGMHLKLRFFDDLARECPIEIINCTRDTAIECFPRLSLEQII